MYDVEVARAQFPALARSHRGRPVAYLDAPGGTQVPEAVIAAMTAVMEAGVSNLGGSFPSSRYAAEITEGARRAGADLFGCAPDEVVFGQNMTSLTFALSRVLARSWRPGERVVVTSLDHDANITPWSLAAAEAGAEVTMVRFDSATYRLDPAAVAAVIDERTRLVAVTHASNALGTVVDVAPIAAAAHRVGALVFVDAVHYTPHGLVDVAAIGADFLVASAYKFFGPHVGLLYGRGELLEELEAYRVRPAPDRGPGKWETGTQSFAALAGVTAAVDYLASWGRGERRRERIGDAHRLCDLHLRGLMERFLQGLGPGVTLYGPAGLEGRTPTFALNVGRLAPSLVAARLGEAGICVWDGHYYAMEVMRQLGLDQGAVRVGFVHTTTADEVDRLLAALADLEDH